MDLTSLTSHILNMELTSLTSHTLNMDLTSNGATLSATGGNVIMICSPGENPSLIRGPNKVNLES